MLQQTISSNQLPVKIIQPSLAVKNNHCQTEMIEKKTLADIEMKMAGAVKAKDNAHY